MEDIIHHHILSELLVILGFGALKIRLMGCLVAQISDVELAFPAKNSPRLFCVLSVHGGGVLFSLGDMGLHFVVSCATTTVRMPLGRGPSR